MRWWRDLSPLGRVMSTPDWSWVHSSNFSSIPSAVLDIRHHRENVISNSTDVTHAWASVIFSQAKNGSNNFMLTSVNHLSSCTESTARRGLSYTSYVSMFPVPPPTFVSAAHMPCHSFEKYKDCFDNNYTEGRAEPNLAWSKARCLGL